MTKDEIIEMARRADWPDSLIAPVIMEKLNDFAKLVAQHEREACIKAIEDQIGWDIDDPQSTAIKVIRARGQA
jgi:hypothetical protein